MGGCCLHWGEGGDFEALNPEPYTAPGAGRLRDIPSGRALDFTVLNCIVDFVESEAMEILQ